MNHGIRADPSSTPGSGDTPINWLPASAGTLTHCVAAYAVYLRPGQIDGARSRQSRIRHAAAQRGEPGPLLDPSQRAPNRWSAAEKASVGQPTGPQGLTNRRARSAAMSWASRSINSSNCGLRTGPFASVVAVGVNVRARRTASSTCASSLIKARTDPGAGTASSNARAGEGI